MASLASKSCFDYAVLKNRLFYSCCKETFYNSNKDIRFENLINLGKMRTNLYHHSVSVDCEHSN